MRFVLRKDEDGEVRERGEYEGEITGVWRGRDKQKCKR